MDIGCQLNEHWLLRHSSGFVGLCSSMVGATVVGAAAGLDVGAVARRWLGRPSKEPASFVAMRCCCEWKSVC